jgi:hypothetical protein
MSAGRARAALALICAASVLTLVLLGTRLTFFGDDWAFLLGRPGLGAHALLDDHNGHLSVLAVLISKLLVALFGLESQVPFRLVLSFAVSALGIVGYALVSERAGRPAGLVAAALIVFLGPAWEDLLWGFQIGFVGSLATGLGALLALERDTARRNAAACVLLVISMGLSDVAIPLIVAAAIAVALRRRPGQAWIPLVPLSLFIAWFATYGRGAQSGLSWDNLRDVPGYVLDSAAAGIASLTGFAPEGWFAGTTAWGRPLLALALLGVLAWVVRGGRPAAGVLVFLGGALAFWGLTGANFTPGRAPDSSRYQLVGATFLILIAAELLRPLRLGRPATLAALALAVVAFGSNLTVLASGFRTMRDFADDTRADLGALEIARGAVPRDFRLVEAVTSDRFLRDVTAGRYFEETDAHGSPAWSPERIGTAGDKPRQSADGVLVAAYRVRLAPAHRPAARSGCRVVEPHADVGLPRGGAVLVNRGDAPLQIALRRFAPADLARRLGRLPGRAAARVAIRGDGVSVPWRVTTSGRPTLQVCPL